jgi:hypothetical protein
LDNDSKGIVSQSMKDTLHILYNISTLGCMDCYFSIAVSNQGKIPACQSTVLSSSFGYVVRNSNRLAHISAQQPSIPQAAEHPTA